MAVQATGSSTATATTAAATQSALTFSKDDFLKILTTQLQYQNPLEPMQPDQFMGQLAQLTQVEQLTNIASSLDAMQQSSGGNNVAQWLGAIGKKVGVDSNILSKGDQVQISPSGDYDKVILTLTDVQDRSTKQVTLNQGDSLTYTQTDDRNVMVSATAYKGSAPLDCTLAVARVVHGIQTDSNGTLVVLGSGETYPTSQITDIEE